MSNKIVLQDNIWQNAQRRPRVSPTLLSLSWLSGPLCSKAMLRREQLKVSRDILAHLMLNVSFFIHIFLNKIPK